MDTFCIILSFRDGAKRRTRNPELQGTEPEALDSGFARFARTPE